MRKSYTTWHHSPSHEHFLLVFLFLKRKKTDFHMMFIQSYRKEQAKKQFNRLSSNLAIRHFNMRWFWELLQTNIAHEERKMNRCSRNTDKEKNNIITDIKHIFIKKEKENCKANVTQILLRKNGLQTLKALFTVM